MNVEELIAAAGGFDEDGAVRLPARLWDLLDGAPSMRIFGDDHRTVVAELRLTPGGAAVHHSFDNGFWLLSPEEVEELAGGQIPPPASHTQRPPKENS